MKTSLKIPLLVLAVVANAFCVRAQTTAFTYHGILNRNRAPVTGLYDIRFAVYDSMLGGTLVASPPPFSSVGVTNGLFIVRVDFGTGVFTGPARWIEVSVRPAGTAIFETLSPRQELTSSPYAIRAQSAGTAADVSNGTVVKSLNSLRDNVTLAGGANVTITPSGNTLTINSSGTGAFSLNGNDAVYTAGNVGIGTTTPNHRLRISGGPTWTANGWLGSVELDNAAAIAWRGNAAGNRFGIGQTGGGLFFFNSASDPGNPDSPANYLMTIHDSGNVGIGTIFAPTAKLDVRGSLVLDPGGSPTLYTSASDGEQFRYLNLINSPSFASASGLKAGGILVSDSYAFADPGKNDLIVKGKIGIGTPFPSSALEIAAQDALSIEGFQPFITMEDSSAFGQISAPRRYFQVTGDDLHFSYRRECNTFPCPAVEGHMTIKGNGNVGIGTFSPESKLHVHNAGTAGARIKSDTDRAELALDSTIGGQRRVWTLESGLFGAPGLFGIYDQTIARARLTIDTAGVVGVDVLQIRGGSDLSEHFDVKAASAPPQGAKAGAAEPGMVACIDPENPGKLVISFQAYDQRVAGIISGAGGVKPGMLMSQAGSVADGSHPVALTGRVYCFVDASKGSVAPGDLLTTSDTPGHAMKVTDHAKAQGAILGKAMTNLKEGKGMVLVLVTLQ